jgi:zinc transport system substrate-binding protein
VPFLRKTLSIIFCLIGACHAIDERPLVLVSVPAYQSIVQEMAGEAIDVQTVVPPTTSFHAFDPTPKRIQELRQAKLWYIIGEPFERRIREAFCHQKTPPAIVDLRTGLSLIGDGDGDEGSTDPHIWTSPKMMMSQLDTIRDGLVHTFPQIEEDLDARYLTVQERCGQLVEQANARLSGQRGKVIVIAHGAYGYLCRDYGIEQLAVETGGKEATVGALDELIKKAREREVKTVFSTTQHPKQGINRIAQVLHAKVVNLNPSQPDYFVEESETINAFGDALSEET